MTLDDKKIIYVPLERVDDSKQSGTRYCFMEMTAELRITLSEVVRRYNETFPEEMTSQPNLANKLRRGGIKDYELARYAYALGYRLALIPTGEKPQPISRSKPETVQLSIFDYGLTDEELYNRLSFDELLALGFASTNTSNFPNVFIAGENAETVASLIAKSINDQTKPTDELILFSKLEKQFRVKIKPLK